MPSWKTFIDRQDAKSIDVQGIDARGFHAQGLGAEGFDAEDFASFSRNVRLKPPGA
jgi:hypothetical protein